MDSEKSKRADYNVVVNHEDQYSIWLVDRELPPRAIGSGSAHGRGARRAGGCDRRNWRPAPDIGRRG